MSKFVEIEVIFLTPEEEHFIGTPAEIANELYRRVRIYGSCGYKIPAKPSILFEMEQEDV